MTFGEKVKYARMKLKLSQSVLGEKIGVSYTTICRWEKENRSPQAIGIGKFFDFCEESGIDFKDAEKYGGGV